VKPAAGGAFVQGEGVAGTDGACLPKLHGPAVLPQGGKESLRLPE
jgi:hypothetical protein